MNADVAMPGLRILVVEDEYFIAVDLIKRLENEGVQVVGPAATIDDALELIETQALDGAVLDLNLGGEMAFPVADALHARGVPFVFATGYDRAVIPYRYNYAPSFEKLANAAKIARALFS